MPGVPGKASGDMPSSVKESSTRKKTKAKMTQPSFQAGLPDRRGLLPAIVEPLYRPLYYFLGTVGLDTPAKRAVAGAAVGYLFQEIFPTDLSHMNIGTADKPVYVPKRWSVIQPKAGRRSIDPDTITWFPWWMWPTSFAVVLSMFI